MYLEDDWNRSRKGVYHAREKTGTEKGKGKSFNAALEGKNARSITLEGHCVLRGEERSFSLYG